MLKREYKEIEKYLGDDDKESGYRRVHLRWFYFLATLFNYLLRCPCDVLCAVPSLCCQVPGVEQSVDSVTEEPGIVPSGDDGGSEA